MAREWNPTLKRFQDTETGRILPSADPSGQLTLGEAGGSISGLNPETAAERRARERRAQQQAAPLDSSQPDYEQLSLFDVDAPTQGAASVTWVTTADSSRINGYAYDPARQFLFVQFKRQNQSRPVSTNWAYENITPEEFSAFVSSGSKGASLNTFVNIMGKHHDEYLGADFPGL